MSGPGKPFAPFTYKPPGEKKGQTKMEHYYDKTKRHDSHVKQTSSSTTQGSGAKCVAGQSLVALPGIGLVRMENLCRDVQPGQTVERRAGFLSIATETGQARVTQLYRSHNDGIIDTCMRFVIETRLGYRIECTADHPLREAVVDRAGRVTGMRWRVACDLHVGTLVKLRLGTKAATKPGLVVVPDADMAERIGNSLRQTTQNGKVWTVPRAVLQGSLDVQRAFVRGLFAVHLHTEAAHLFVASEDTACDVQTLMANLGYAVARRRHCHQHDSWQLIWRPVAGAIRGYLYDYVASITLTAAAKGPVYNVYVPGPHSYICNGFVTHNAAAAAAPARAGPVTANGRVGGMSRVCSVSTLLHTLECPETIGFYETQ